MPNWDSSKPSGGVAPAVFDDQTREKFDFLEQALRVVMRFAENTTNPLINGMKSNTSRISVDTEANRPTGADANDTGMIHMATDTGRVFLLTDGSANTWVQITDFSTLVTFAAGMVVATGQKLKGGTGESWLRQTDFGDPETTVDMDPFAHAARHLAGGADRLKGVVQDILMKRYTPGLVAGAFAPSSDHPTFTLEEAQLGQTAAWLDLSGRPSGTTSWGFLIVWFDQEYIDNPFVTYGAEHGGGLLATRVNPDANNLYQRGLRIRVNLDGQDIDSYIHPSNNEWIMNVGGPGASPEDQNTTGWFVNPIGISQPYHDGGIQCYVGVGPWFHRVTGLTNGVAAHALTVKCAVETARIASTTPDVDLHWANVNVAFLDLGVE